MIDTTGNTNRNWLLKWVTIRGIDPFKVTIPYNVEREERYRTNLLANRGPFPIRTDHGTESL